MEYLLKHKDITVAELTLDGDASITKINRLYRPERLPVGSVLNGIADRFALNEWWIGRSIPTYRQDIQPALDTLNVSLPQKLLEKNLGLSLSDQYWICPASADLSWSKVNFFTNGFSKDVGDILFGKGSDSESISLMSPDNTSDGWLKKRWTIMDGKRCLIKGGSGANQQEPYNEVIAGAVLGRLGIPHVPYALVLQDEYPFSVCEDFVTSKTELIGAWHIMKTMKKDNHTSIHQHYLNCCEKLGIAGMQHAVDQMIVLDYLIVNEDRHQNNFGVLRNADTLEWLGAAPIFDSGSSLWFATPTQLIRPSASHAKCKPFKTSHEEQIGLVASFDWLDLSKLDGLREEISDLVSDSPFIDSARFEAITKGLTGRIKMLEQHILTHQPRLSTTATHDIQENTAYHGEQEQNSPDLTM